MEKVLNLKIKNGEISFLYGKEEIKINEDMLGSLVYYLANHILENSGDNKVMLEDIFITKLREGETHD